MKKIILSSFAIVFCLFTSQISAQENSTIGKNNYVVLTKKIEQLTPILLTAEALAKEDGEKFGDFQVIVCGKEVTNLTDKEKMDTFVSQAEKTGVLIVACGFSLKKFKVDQTKIPKEINVVQNGILYNFQLQKKGYLSLGL